MNRLVRASLTAVLCLCAAAGAWAQSSSGKPTLDLAAWFAANENWKTVNNGSWSSDPKDAPSDKELTAMLDIACKVQTAVNWNEFFFIVVRDPAEQEAITPADKTTYGFGQYPTPNWNISRFVKGRNYIRA
jgi:hypothetical protein